MLHVAGDFRSPLAPREAPSLTTSIAVHRGDLIREGGEGVRPCSDPFVFEYQVCGRLHYAPTLRLWCFHLMMPYSESANFQLNFSAIFRD